MRFMNDFDISMARRRYADHPILGPATQTIENLMEAANESSDGWHSWPQPARSAAKLMELIEGDGTNRAIDEADKRATPEALKKAYAPIKAFRTRHPFCKFEIVEVGA